MSKEEIKELIKENLKIEISSNYDGLGDNGCNVKVKLLWGEENEEISSSQAFIL